MSTDTCFFRITAIALFCLLFLSGCSLAEIFTGKKTDYQIAGDFDDKKTAAYLEAILKDEVDAKTSDLSKRPDILQRQEEYLEKSAAGQLTKGLQARGYYEARVDYEDGDQPFSGRYDIVTGPLYKISALSTVPSSYSGYLKNDRLETGQALDAAQVLAAQGRLYSNVQKNRCYFSMDVKNSVYLDKVRNSGDVRFDVATGPEGAFGPVQFRGNGLVREDYLRKLVPWKEGDCFRREKIEEFKTSLLQSGLFARADALLPDAPGPDGRVPIVMELKQRAARTISIGGTYYSDEGPGVTLGWQHKNLLGAAENLNLGLTLSQLRQSLDAAFTKPYFLRKDQNLSINGSLRRQETDAFDEVGADVGASIGRKFTPNFSGSTGVALSATRIDDERNDDSKFFGLVSFPQGLTYDKRDDKLNATRGFVLNAGAEPFYDILGEADPFFKTTLIGSSYLSLGTPLDLVFASKAGIGSIIGSSSDNIPATERFFAGGGGSVRGYGFQDVGPKDEDGDPSGGRSLVNLSMEMRSKFTNTIGGAAFVDAGNVSENINPSLDNLAIGAGVGVRYFTSFGPLRFDVAVPLTQKEDLDQNYQFYISIGQAF